MTPGGNAMALGGNYPRDRCPLIQKIIILVVVLRAQITRVLELIKDLLLRQ